MPEMKMLLEEIHIKNCYSLSDVKVPLKPLTILVGPNASGKSNVLSTLYLLNTMANSDQLPPTQYVKDNLWAGAVEGSNIVFQLKTIIEKTRSVYQLELKTDGDSSYAKEKLLVNDVEIISTQNGEGVVRDESNRSPIKYKADKLALRSVGDYGDNPIANDLIEFIKDWGFYNILPEVIRTELTDFSPSIKQEGGESPRLSRIGTTLPEMLLHWHDKTPELFLNVSEGLATSMDTGIEIDRDNRLGLLEGYEKPIPLEKASDGTLRLAAYYALLNQPELPQLIAVEEPERHLHPGVLSEVAQILKQIASRSRVIVTTHSSQFLDSFSSEDLDSIGVLLLNKHSGSGTEILNLEDIRGDRAALDGWITDFGVGSAIFDSGLID